MLAVQAKYVNGAVRWERKPPVQGMHDLIVIFSDVPDSDRLKQEAAPDAVGVDNAGNEEHRSWSGLFLSNLESAYCEDEPEYSDNMLKSPNPEFAP